LIHNGKRIFADVFTILPFVLFSRKWPILTVALFEDIRPIALKLINLDFSAVITAAEKGVSSTRLTKLGWIELGALWMYASATNFQKSQSSTNLP